MHVAWLVCRARLPAWQPHTFGWVPPACANSVLGDTRAQPGLRESQQASPHAGPCPPLQVWLSLNCNKLKGLPKEVGNLSALSRLSLHINEVGVLAVPSSSRHAPLYLCRTQCAAQCADLHQATGQQRLCSIPRALQLESLPAELWKCTNMEALSIHKNHLTFIPPGRLPPSQPGWGCWEPCLPDVLHADVTQQPASRWSCSKAGRGYRPAAEPCC